jgi:hypothetical protein
MLNLHIQAKEEEPMATGTTTLLYLQQPAPPVPLTPDNCYFQVRLHSAQAYVESPWLKQADQLVCATQVSSDFAPDHKSGSIHNVITIQKNTPTPLGLSLNLTDWLPAVQQRTVHVDLQLVATMGKPFGELSESIDKLGLASTLTLVHPHLALGAKIAGVTGQIMSVLLQEGKSSDPFHLRSDLNVNDLKAGHYAALSPHQSGDIPLELELRPNGTLAVPRGRLDERTTFAVFTVSVIERRGTEAARGQPWWEALHDAQAEIAQMPLEDEEDRRKINAAWRAARFRIRRLAEQDRSFLREEIRDILRAAELEFRTNLEAPALLEATGQEPFPADVREVLDVATLPQLEHSVAAYKQALERSRQQRAAAGE